MIKKDMIKFVQQQLNLRNGSNLVVDGIFGKNTLAALAQISAIPIEWSNEEKVIGYIQYICLLEGIDAGPIDGKWGPQTEYGYEVLQFVVETGEFPPSWRTDGDVHSSSVKNRWPLQNEKDLINFYGDVGTNQGKVTSPYGLKIAWDKSKTITRFTCHEKVADSIARVLDRTLDHYGIDKIDEMGLNVWGGCLNVRKMRGGTKWSTHSWGIAIDWDPENNKLRWGSDRAKMAGSEYDMWWSLWEEEGWCSLGRAKNYDWMHVMAARV